MKYVDEYRDPRLAERLLEKLRSTLTRPWTIMEVCGGQTHTLVRSGIDELVPPGLRLVHGPGCPVCVTPLEQIDRALALAAMPNVIFCSFGDMLRVPGTSRDLLQVRAEGGTIRIVYSPLDAVRIASEHPDREVVFFAVGFETTAPATALAAHQAHQLGLRNFSMLVAHVLVPPAMEAILSDPANRVKAFLAAGHVCTVMGFEEYYALAETYKVPIVVTGFEPVDLLEGILFAVRQLEEGRHDVENQYVRAVSRAGNRQAQQILAEVYEVCDRPWRGLGVLPRSGLRLSAAYRHMDAELRFALETITAIEPSECRSGEVLQGRLRPAECSAFGTRCTPEHPLGAPMVSSEGACSAYYKYGRRRAELPPHHNGERAELVMTTRHNAGLNCPVPHASSDRVLLAHGEGARLTRRLLRELLLDAFDNPILRPLADGAILRGLGSDMVMTTDSFVVSPLVFPGGDIGQLAVHGTVNDLAVCGAKPMYLGVALILEEGLPMELLRRIVHSMRDAAQACGVQVVTGDTKVVPRGAADAMFVTTTGLGSLQAGVRLGTDQICPGDRIIVSGTIGDHGIAVLSAREGLDLGSSLQSDSAPIYELVQSLLTTAADVRFLRDPTRGGVSAVLHELAEASQLSMIVEEAAIPVSEPVRGACEILGLDPLYVANEGKLVAIIAPKDAEHVLATLRCQPLGRQAAIIGEVAKANRADVLVRGPLGALRVLDEPSGAPLPRIC